MKKDQGNLNICFFQCRYRFIFNLNKVFYAEHVHRGLKKVWGNEYDDNRKKRPLFVW